VLSVRDALINSSCRRSLCRTRSGSRHPIH
jgi:hypothetical protein